MNKLRMRKHLVEAEVPVTGDHDGFRTGLSAPDPP